MTIWVTGAKGFIGRHVARAIAREGTRVVGLGHGAWVEHEYAAWGIDDWLNGEVGAANLDALATRHGLPEAVIHLAGGSSVGQSIATPGEDFRRSVVATAQLLEWLRVHAPTASLAMASSAAVYGAGHSGPIAEAVECNPYSPYGAHKRMAELLVESYARNFGLRSAIVRLFSVYGPELRKQLLWDACVRLSRTTERLQLGGNGRELRDWIHVEDTATVLAIALRHASVKPAIVNGGTGIATSVQAIADRLGELWTVQGGAVFSGEARSGDPASLVANVDQLFGLGFQPRVDLREGLAEYVAWFRDQISKRDK